MTLVEAIKSIDEKLNVNLQEFDNDEELVPIACYNSKNDIDPQYYDYPVLSCVQRSRDLVDVLISN